MNLNAFKEIKIEIGSILRRIREATRPVSLCITVILLCFVESRTELSSVAYPCVILYGLCFWTALR